MASEFPCYISILWNGIGLVAKNYEWVYWMEITYWIDIRILVNAIVYWTGLK